MFNITYLELPYSAVYTIVQRVGWTYLTSVLHLFHELTGSLITYPRCNAAASMLSADLHWIVNLSTGGNGLISLRQVVQVVEHEGWKLTFVALPRAALVIANASLYSLERCTHMSSDALIFISGGCLTTPSQSKPGHPERHVPEAKEVPNPADCRNVYH